METLDKAIEQSDAVLRKYRRYVSDPSEAPEGKRLKRGTFGGYYYETGAPDPGAAAAPAARQPRSTPRQPRSAKQPAPAPAATFNFNNPKPEEKVEISQLYQTARTALAGGDDGRWARMNWTAKEYAKAHPGVNAGAVYKYLDRNLPR